MNKKAGFAEKNCGYCKQDSIVFVDKWVNCLFGCFAAGIIWRTDDPMSLWVLFGFGPKPGCFLVQKRNETPETPETLDTTETLSVDAGIVVL